MSVELRRSLPDYYTELYEVGAILDTVSKELTRLEDTLDRAFANLSATTAVNHLEMWEKDLSIVPGGSFEGRRQAILAKIGLMGIVNAETVLGSIRAFSSEAEAYLEEKGDSVDIVITEKGGVYTDFSHLTRELKKALPYHLTANIGVNSTLNAVSVPRTESRCRMEMTWEIGDEQ